MIERNTYWLKVWLKVISNVKLGAVLLLILVQSFCLLPDLIAQDVKQIEPQKTNVEQPEVAEPQLSSDTPLIINQSSKAKQQQAQQKAEKEAAEKAKKPQLPSATATPEKNPQANSNTLVEELQRFFGYENPILSRYISLPYDVSINTNVSGFHVEIGFLLLMFLPILLLLGLGKRPFLGILTMLGCLLLLVISTSNSFIFSPSYQVVKSNGPNIDRYLAKIEFWDTPVGYLCGHIYRICIDIYEPIKYIFSFISGAKDAITYPIFLALFVFFFYLIQKRTEHHSLTRRTIIAFLLLYWFFWLMMSGGIVWYGYLVLPLGILLLLSASEKYKIDGSKTKKIVFGTMFAFMMIWVGLTYVVRISHIQQVNRNAGKYLLNAAVVQYQAGVFSEQQVFDYYLKNVNDAIEQINSEDESLIYRAGTAFSFFIRKNDKRVMNDNLFGFFQSLNRRYKNKSTIAKVLKASNFRYIIVDLNAAGFDQTPDQSVKRKFNKFMDFLKQNPDLSLLATNRTVKKKDKDGNTYVVNDVFGEVQYRGSYAVYEIK